MWIDRRGRDGSVTLGEVLVQVEVESSAAEAEHLGGLREQAGVGQASLAHGVDQQQGAHVTTLTLYRRRHGTLLGSISGTVYTSKS